MKGIPYMLMRGMAVLPEWQGKGVGKRLLEWGTGEADKRGLECWVNASEGSVGFFERFGWKRVGVVEAEEGEMERVVQCIRKPREQDA